MSLVHLRSARHFSIFSALTLAVFATCASTTTINSQPTGARVSINGVPVGTTPYAMTDTKIVGSSTSVRLDYPGYQPLDTVISRNEELDALALVGGIFVLVPLLWVMKYKPTHFYELQRGHAPASFRAPGPHSPAPGSAYPAAPPAPVPAPPIGPAGYPGQQ